MQPKARLGDIVLGGCIVNGSPVAWSGTVAQGSPVVLTNGQPVGKMQLMVRTDCDECSQCTIQAGSPTVLAEGVPQARLGDPVTGPSNAQGVIMGGSPNVLTA